MSTPPPPNKKHEIESENEGVRVELDPGTRSKGTTRCSLTCKSINPLPTRPSIFLVHVMSDVISGDKVQCWRKSEGMGA